MNQNRFVWHDLNVKDVEGAKRFYGELFNWKFGKSDNGAYTHIEAGAQMIGGIRELGADEPPMSNWLSYVAVDDVAATVAKITAAQGRVYVPAKVLENVGTFAVTADPAGGVFAPWKSARPGENVEAAGFPALSTFCWDELLSTDPAAAAAFYTEVFGWTGQTMDMGPAGLYTMLTRPGTTNEKGQPRGAGGIMKAPQMVKQSFWLPYIAVDNVDQSTERAKKFGATIHMPPSDIPGMGRFSSWQDPVGAQIAVFSAAKN